MVSAPESKYESMITRRRRPLEGRPVVASRESEKCWSAGGKKMIPTHWKLSQNVIDGEFTSVPLIASPEKITTVQASTTAKDCDTLSLKLKVKDLMNRDNAVIAIPASKIWFIALKICSISNINIFYNLRPKNKAISLFSK